MEEQQKFAIVHWEDKFTSLINLDLIKFPRKPVNDYKDGEFVSALYGKKKYKARISEINGPRSPSSISSVNRDRAYLASKKTTNGSFPLKFTYDKVGSPSKERTGSDIETDKETDINFEITEENTEDELVASNADCHEEDESEVDKMDQDHHVETHSTSSLRPEMETPTGKNTSHSLAHHSSSRQSSSQRLERRVEQVEKELKELRSSFRSLKRKFSEMSSSSSGCSGSNVFRMADETLESSVSAPKASKCVLEVDTLLTEVSHISGNTDKEVNECARRISLSVFSRQDLVTCSRTGKKTMHSPGENARPALDAEKMKLVEQAVMTKCSIKADAFKKKFDNLVKMERRSYKTSN